MSFPRLALLFLMVFGLPMLAGGCAAPLVVAGASYGADGVSLLNSGKTTTDHLTSMVTKKDCAFWRVFRRGKICRQREGEHDPYDVNYDEPEREIGEGGQVRYRAPLHAAPDAPAVSWDRSVYDTKAEAKPAPAQPEAPPVVAEAPAEPAPMAEETPPPKPKPKAKKSKPRAPKKQLAKHVRKPSPDQVASSP